ncbi:MAG: site-specific DNA-methyltransferase [Propionibacteriaceae bacterium]|jgi:adenine-specific DNA-methyltransferase|nr:site-specific DNA-methyltransferase [Propionibacteriaceae bacterium]
MADVELTWENKHLSLRGTGTDQYTWVVPGAGLVKAQTTILTAGPITRDSNVLAIGDSLDVLEALSRQTEAFDDGIRLVYVDPPFNTGKAFRHYGDHLQRPMWLSMIRDRLAALKPLLTPDASVWMHLDDSEVHRARAIMDEIFGERAFVTSVAWQKRTTRDSRAAFSANHDTILVYAPSGPKAWKTRRNLLTRDRGHMTNRDNDPRGPWTDAPFTAPGYRAGQQYVIMTPTGRPLKPPRGRSWYATKSTYLDLLSDDRIWFPKDGDGSPRLKLFPHQIRGLVPFTIWNSADTGTNDDAKRHLMDLFPGTDVFDTPKPETLLERIVHISTDPGELVVDLFAGSGTTAAVSHKMHRRWVAVERSVPTVSDFALPRLCAVAKGDDPGGITRDVGWTGGGVFEVVAVPPVAGGKPGSYSAASLRRTLQLPSSGVYNRPVALRA